MIDNELEDCTKSIKKIEKKRNKIEKIKLKRQKVHNIRTACAICIAFVFLSVYSILGTVYKEMIDDQLFNVIHLSSIFIVMMGSVMYILFHQTKFDNKLANHDIDSLCKQLRLIKKQKSLLNKKAEEERNQEEKTVMMENY